MGVLAPGRTAACAGRAIGAVQAGSGRNPAGAIKARFIEGMEHVHRRWTSCRRREPAFLVVAAARPHFCDTPVRRADEAED